MSHKNIDPHKKINLFHVQLMRYHEEVLAQSARNYVFTNDKKWEERYFTLVSEATRLLEYAKSHCKKHDVGFFFKMADANDVCVKLEKNAIFLVNTGARNDALNILEGNYYNSKREQLKGGLENYIINNQHHASGEIDDAITPLISEIVRLERNLAEKELEINNTKLATIGGITTRIAHDIRDPLSVIKTTIEILQTRNDSKFEKYYKILDEKTQRIYHQIEDVLSIVQVKPLELSKASTKSIIEKSLESVSIGKNIKIIFKKTNFDIICDKTKITNSIVNILTNAIYAIGKDVGEIKINQYKQNGNVIITIENSGPKIPESVIDRIFEPLVTTKQTGAGLGLVASKTMIEQHGGTITVNNHPTTFTIILPDGK